MITINLNGRLGNQLFQYALGRHLSILHNTDLKFEMCIYPNFGRYIKSLFNYEKALDENRYRLDIFNINTKPKFIFMNKNHLSKKHKYFFGTKVVREKYFHYDSTILKETPDNIYLWGYWQSQAYFSDIESVLRKELTFRDPVLMKSQGILKKIQSTESVCLHVRRGDYVTSTFHNVVSNSPIYFLKGAKYVTDRLHKAPHFFIFSDDPIWCKNNIKLPYPTTFVNQEHAGRKDGNHLQLMKNCKHFVLSNSSFSWWGAWLSNHREKIVVAPKRWVNSDKDNDSDVVPENWVQL